MQVQKLLLVDDHEVIRFGLGTILEDEPRFKIVAYAKNKTEALKELRNNEIDIAIIDIRLKNESGIELCQEITKEFPKIKVIMLTSFCDDNLIIKAIKAGARGYLLKEVSNDNILRGLNEVANGGYLFDPVTTGRVIDILKNLNNESKEYVKDKLSQIEYKILALLGKGKTNNEIAEILNINLNVVKNSVTSILRKLQFHNRSEAAIFAAKHNISEE